MGRPIHMHKFSQWGGYTLETLMNCVQIQDLKKKTAFVLKTTSLSHLKNTVLKSLDGCQNAGLASGPSHWKIL